MQIRKAGMEDEGRIAATAIINQLQVDAYNGAPWQHEASDNEVCVLHTLAVSPAKKGHDYGKRFVKFYEDYALEHGLRELRMDTNEKNPKARAIYKKLGYKEIAIVPTVFKNIPGIKLVLLEKYLG